MTKKDLVDQMAEDADISKLAAEKAYNSFFSSVTKTLKKEGKITFTGFGTFAVTKRKARKGRNPQTGEEIKIKANKSVRFKPGATLKKSI
jgi:DNA-binding protein HU-beta